MYTLLTILLLFSLYGYFHIRKNNDKDERNFENVLAFIFDRDYLTLKGKWYFIIGWALIKCLSYVIAAAAIVALIILFVKFLP